MKKPDGKCFPSLFKNPLVIGGSQPAVFPGVWAYDNGMSENYSLFT